MTENETDYNYRDWPLSHIKTWLSTATLADIGGNVKLRDITLEMVRRLEVRPASEPRAGTTYLSVTPLARCERCQTVNRETFLSALTGGRNTRLCQRCLDEWNTLAHTHESYRDLLELWARRDTMVSDMRGSSQMPDWQALHGAIADTTRRLYVLACGWIESGAADSRDAAELSMTERCGHCTDREQPKLATSPASQNPNCTWCNPGGWRRKTCDICGVGSQAAVVVSVQLDLNDPELDYPYTTTALCHKCWIKHGLQAAADHNREIRAGGPPLPFSLLP